VYCTKTCIADGALKGAGNSSCRLVTCWWTRGVACAAGTTPTTGRSRGPSPKRCAGPAKRAAYHCLRHSFATHRIEGGYDIRTVQELLGHASVETMMIYTHVFNRGGRRVRSPLDGPGGAREGRVVVTRFGGG